ncbi:hypothetical protein AgCh_022307 [Apium graveolens]
MQPQEGGVRGQRPPGVCLDGRPPPVVNECPHWGCEVNSGVCFGSSVSIVNMCPRWEISEYPALSSQKLGITCPAIWLFLNWLSDQTTVGLVCEGPSTPNSKIDLLAEINMSPHILLEVDAAFKGKQMKSDVNDFLKTKQHMSSFLSAPKKKLMLVLVDATQAGIR